MGRKHHRFVEDAEPLGVTSQPLSKSTDRELHCAIRSCLRPPAIHVGMTNGGVCEYHADVIWAAFEWRDARDRHQDVPGMEGRDYIRVDARAVRERERRKPSSVGEIYFVRVDELIKVGWTSKLADRVRSYGPKAELLAHYPGTRADEAALHRQLTPARFRGREWYSDGPILQGYITEALERHGPPRFERIEWTEPKKQGIRSRGR